MWAPLASSSGSSNRIVLGVTIPTEPDCISALWLYRRLGTQRDLRRRDRLRSRHGPPAGAALDRASDLDRIMGPQHAHGKAPGGARRQLEQALLDGQQLRRIHRELAQSHAQQQLRQRELSSLL